MAELPSSVKLSVVPPEPALPSIQAALAWTKDAVGAVAKKDRNTAQNFNFRGVDAVVNAAAPALNKFGVVIIPQVVSHVYEQVETASKKQAAHVIVEVDYQFHGPAGDYLTARVIAEAMDYGDKAVAKAMSVAYRTALLQVLNLPTDEKDPDEETFERTPKESSSRPQSATSTGRASAGPEFNSAAALLLKVREASTPEEVRGYYKYAANAGWLKENVTFTDTAEKVIVDEYITQRGNDLKHGKSAGNSSRNTPGKGDQ